MLMDALYVYGIKKQVKYGLIDYAIITVHQKCQ